MVKETEEIFYLGFGSNMGNMEEIIEKAISMICQVPDITLIKKSSYWLTEPWGDKNQEWFTNCVASFEAKDLTPYSLLEKIAEIEYNLHRVRDKNNRNAARTIDIDILDFKPYTFCETMLTIPHIRMFERAFVLVPLEEIAPDYTHEGRGIKSYLAEINYKIEGNKIFQK